MKYKIEKNIKIPARGGQPGELNKVIRQMQPGDSIVVGSKKERDTFAAICYRLNYAFASRKIDNTKNFRCWLKPKQDLEKQKKQFCWVMMVSLDLIKYQAIYLKT